jgi:hypothetical protein
MTTLSRVALAHAASDRYWGIQRQKPGTCEPRCFFCVHGVPDQSLALREANLEIDGQPACDTCVAIFDGPKI